MVKAHNGSFDAEPRPVKGSTFRIFLPAADTGSRNEGRGSTS
jgi:signal transduction histidine kinase